MSDFENNREVAVSLKDEGGILVLPPEEETDIHWATDLKVIKYALMWKPTLKFFENKRVVKSPSFRFGITNEFEAQICLYPSGITEDSDYIDIYVKFLAPEGRKEKAKLRIGFLDCVDIKSDTFEIDIFVNMEDTTPEGWGSRYVFLAEDLKVFGYILCEIHLVIDTLPNYKNDKSNIPKKLISSYSSLLETGDSADVEIVVGEATLRAHKIILASRSAVFKAMLEIGMTESATRSITIVDVGKEAVEELLRFIYTGHATLSRLENLGEELLYLANKYDLEDLTELCEKHLIAKINVENAARTLQLAVFHAVPNLRGKAAAFIQRHLKEVTMTEGWKAVKKSWPVIFVESLLESSDVSHEKSCNAIQFNADP